MQEVFQIQASFPPDTVCSVYSLRSVF